MTHEQKPEIAEFRTREAQRRHIAQSWADEGMSYALAYEWANRELKEAEARGAAEQRRKDAEGAEPVKWQRDNTGNGWIDTPVEDLPFYRERGFPIRPLYTRPANVAALIAEAVAAERVRCAKMLDASAIHAEECGANWGERYAKHWAAAIRKGEQ